MTPATKTVLICDDDQGMRDTIAAILGRDYRVLTVSSGEAGLALLRQEDVDLILLDVRLPGISGFELLKIVKENFSLVEVIMISAINEIETAVQAMKHGAYHYMTKTFDYDTMRSLVAKAIERQELNRQVMTLSAQVEQRNNDETVRRLNAAVEALFAFAIVNGRLPCPAVAGAGDEAPAGGGPCTTFYGGATTGFLPARTIGFQPVDSSVFGIDAWNNPIRYAVASLIIGCTGTSVTPHFTSQANLKANGISCRPNDLDICAPTDTTTACTAANRVVSTSTVAFLVFSTGKNGAIAGAQGAHESANVDGNAAFISRTPSGADATPGAYDDLMVVVPAGVVYSRLISAGVLP